jgi:DNA (cytosine-5)-methyltransferase 1
MKAVSLFASGGIGDLSLKAIGVDVIVANELLEERAEVFKYNFPKCNMHIGSILDLKTDIIEDVRLKLRNKKLDFLIATPPCQGMSKNGRGKLLSLIRNGERPKLDPRNQLIVPTVDIAKKLSPEIIVFENVPEMKDTLIEYDNKLINIIDFIRQELEPMGYVGSEEVVEFSNYGVPQRRQRLITIFSKNKRLKEYFNIHFSFLPTSTHSQNLNRETKPWVTVRDTIGDVPKLDGKDKKNATSNDIEYHRVPLLDTKKYFWVSNTPPEKGAFDNQCVKCGYNENPIHGASKDKNGINRSHTETPIRCLKCNELLPRPWVNKSGEYRLMKGFTSAYRRMKWDLPATALTTNLSYACSDSKLHPEQNRVLSLYEAFKIHTISKYDYSWSRADNKRVSDKLIREIIGESIPPFGLEVILKHLKEIYKEKNLSLMPLDSQLKIFKEPKEVYNLVP